MIELIVLIISLIIILVVIRYKSNYSENFENTYTLDKCPKGFKSIYTEQGDIICCDGEMIGNKCLSNNVCTLTGGNSNIPNCINIIQDKYKTEATNNCPSSMPTYYENNTIKGCTNGTLNSTLNGPKSISQKSCIIYKTQNDNITNVDSCYNYKELDSFPCFGNNCSKQLIQPVTGGPVLVAISFLDNNNIHHMSYTRNSFERFLNATNPNWKSRINLDKNIHVAEVAKAYYIDRTLQKDDIEV